MKLIRILYAFVSVTLQLIALVYLNFNKINYPFVISTKSVIKQTRFISPWNLKCPR